MRDTVNLYEFDELSAEAKQTAIEQQRGEHRIPLEDRLDESVRFEMEASCLGFDLLEFNDNHLEVRWETGTEGVKEIARWLASKKKISHLVLGVIEEMEHFDLLLEYKDEEQTHAVSLRCDNANDIEHEAADRFHTALTDHIEKTIHTVGQIVREAFEQLYSDDYIIATIREKNLRFSADGFLWTWDSYSVIADADNSQNGKGTGRMTTTPRVSRQKIGSIPIAKHAEIALTSSGNLLNFIQRIVMDDDRLCELTGFPRETCKTTHAAARVAEDAHHGTNRKGTDIPYIMHPFGVAALLLREQCTPEMVIAGLLHDTVEDAGFTLQEIADGYGKEVADIVEGCSEPDKSLSWQERKEHTIHYLKTAPYGVRMVTCADKLHNIKSIVRDFEELGNDLWTRFNAGKDQQAWYYKGLVASLSCYDFVETAMYQEFKELVKATFCT